MNKIKDALGMGHSHSHTSSGSNSAANCPECQSTTTGTSYAAGSNYGTGANINPSLASGQSTTTTTTTTGTGYGNSGIGTDNAMTRSEEQILVGKERVATGQAALKKNVTTEHVETNLPLVQEKIVLQREPITEANRGAALSGQDIKEAEHVVTTSAERPIVQKEVVAKERVHLGKVAEVTNQPVGGEIRKEHISLQQGAPMMTGSSTSAYTTSTTGTADPLYNKDSTYSSTQNSARKTAY